MNAKIRFRNKAWLTTFVATCITIIYQGLELFGITPSVNYEEVIDLVTLILSMLTMLGVVIDPTTEGVKDSELVMSKKGDNDD